MQLKCVLLLLSLFISKSPLSNSSRVERIARREMEDIDLIGRSPDIGLAISVRLASTGVFFAVAPVRWTIGALVAAEQLYMAGHGAQVKRLWATKDN